MKVVFLTANQFTDDSWTDPRVYQQAQSLLHAGHEVVVLGTGKYGQSPAPQEIKDGIKVCRYPTLMHRLYGLVRPSSEIGHKEAQKRNIYYAHRMDTHSLGDRLRKRLFQLAHDVNTLLFCLAILPAAVRQRADVYVGRGLEGLAPAYIAARLTGGKLVYDSLELWTERVRAVPYGRWHKAAIRWIEKRLCRRCDLVTTVTQSIAYILVERYRIPEPLVIPNAYYSYVAVPPSSELRRQLGGDEDRRIVVFVGYLDYGKGLESLIDAGQFLDNSTMISIIGDGVLRPMLENRIMEKHLGDRVRLMGWIAPDDLPAYLSSADLGICPAESSTLNYYYGAGYKLYQYITVGLPLALSDQPERRRLVEQYQIGAVFDETDPRDVARVINGLLSDPVRYQAMRERAAKVGREELNWEVVSRQFVAAIEQLQK